MNRQPASLEQIDIVVVDDNRTMLNLMRTICRSIGIHRIRVFQNVEEGMNDIRVIHPDILITDYEMEPITGLDLVHMIRSDSNPVLKRLPILMVTAHSHRGLVLEARDTGVDDFIVKPVSPERVEAGIRAMIERKARSAASAPPNGDNQGMLPGKDGGDTAQQAIKLERLRKAEQEIRALKEQYERDLLPAVTQLATLLSQIEAGQLDPDRLPKAFRAAHDFKGQGASFGYPLLSEFAGSLARLLRDKIQLTEVELKIARAHADALIIVARNRIRGDGGQTGRALRQSFERMVAKIGGQ
ncbi:response regulator [Ferrovibrio sp.]|uniref:Hpt domain-containing response regulator n=1 Tax=Ferrovibrio sp. TaxID=1917215 RepID=UPI001B799BA6|nr:response regulator [Ferrovibrio sp.]MBP7062807.1 response regulator [Ferrovibrio sp.]